MNTPVREGETIEGSRTTRNDPIQCSSAQGTPREPPKSDSREGGKALG